MRDVQMHRAQARVHARNRWLVWLVWLSWPIALDARGEPPSVRVASPLAQIFPDAPPTGEAAATLEAARGEWEPFQVVVYAGDAPLHALTAQASPLRGPRGATLIAPRLYRVDNLIVKTPSSIEGHAGPWPDALVPAVDAYAEEPRRALPVDLAAHRAQALWAELFVPVGTSPGEYRGTITVAARELSPTVVALTLTVHRFTLPRSSSLPVTFGFDAGAIARAHPGLSPAAQQQLIRRYEVAALRHRISVHGGSMEPPPFVTRGGQLELDFSAYDAEVGPFLDGTADRGGPAEGARWSTFDLRIPARLVGAERSAYIRAMVAHLAERGWLDRVFDYTYDEPPDGAFDELRRRATVVHGAAPAIPRLVTHAWEPRLHGAVDIWCPVVNFVDDKPGNSSLPGRAAYAAHAAHGERLWWYQACMSHGCNIVGGDYFTGWPSYAIDAPAVAHRIFEWLTFRYRIGGELYYHTVAAYARGLDPWVDQYLYGGNGDGTLFYPGRRARIGGASDIPIESIRLKLIREGLEDYEYLRLYAEVAGQAAAEELAATIAPKTYRWEHDGARLLAARHRMAEAIDRALAQAAAKQAKQP
jgi:hypothetical protein